MSFECVRVLLVVSLAAGSIFGYGNSSLYERA